MVFRSFAPFLFAQLDGPIDWTRMTNSLIAVAVLAAIVFVPFFVGSWLAKSLRMPTYGFRLGVILFSITAAVFVLWRYQMKFGVDLRGGTILVYELEQQEMIAGGDGQMQQAADTKQAKDLMAALTERLNPSGTNEIVIRPYGDNQLEIIVPNTNENEVEVIKDKIKIAGILRFAIVANGRDHPKLIERATKNVNSDKQEVRAAKEIRDDENRVIGVWAAVDREDKSFNPNRPLRVEVSGDILRNAATGEMLNAPRLDPEQMTAWMESQGIDNVEVLMAINPDFDITGEELSSVASAIDQMGSPAVDFSLKDISADRFYALTLKNSPEGEFYRRLGIILDGRLMSAPRINSAIRSRGTIEGRFTREEVDFLVGILRSGSLPAALVKTPVAENQIGSTLGADTIQKGKVAIGSSIIAVLIFVAIYYRIPGVVACIALMLNVLFIMGVMVLFSVPMTLSGLAGLVLTVGMSVDANVLIFERIREEHEKGSAIRMAVRNGFSRAMTTIVDANLTTLITGIVLYAIGTDQVRGFAATLILGIVFSMYTAIYVARTIFDILERQGWLNLEMSNLVANLRDAIGGATGIDFMGKRPLAVAFSLILMGLGIAALVQRGAGILDIDFRGGSSVVFQLKEPTAADDVRQLVDKALNTDAEQKVQTTLTRYIVSDTAADTTYKLDTSIEDIDYLKEQLFKSLVDDDGDSLLISYEATLSKPDTVKSLETTPAAGAPALKDSGSISQHPLIRTVAFRPQDEAVDAKPSEEKSVSESDEKADAPASDAPAKDTPADDAPGKDTSATSDTTSPAKPADDQPEATQTNKPREIVQSTGMVHLAIQGSDKTAAINAETLKEQLLTAAKAANVSLVAESIHLKPIGEGAEDWKEQSSLRFADWEVTLDLPAIQADPVMGGLKELLQDDPVLLSSSKIGTRVAESMKGQAIGAIVVSLLFIIVYIWFRFHRFVYGLAAVIALVHDVIITLGAIAASTWLAQYLGFLLVEDFKISLSVVAALMTIVGYSLNDTIVVFDRIREVKGKSPDLNADMINRSINQTLSRTLLTSLTTLVVVVILYAIGGDGIHAFAFSLLIGITIGTYSSIYIASPILLWLGASTERVPVYKRSTAE